MGDDFEALGGGGPVDAAEIEEHGESQLFLEQSAGIEPRVAAHDGGLVAVGVGIHAGSTECLRPIRGEALDMLGMETVAERMADYFVGHNPTMPGSGKAAQAVDAARCLEDSEHASMMTSVPRPGKTTAAPRIRGDSGRVTRNSRRT